MLWEWGDGRQLGALAVLSEDLCPVPSTHMASRNCLGGTLVLGDPVLSAGLCRHGTVLVYKHTFSQTLIKLYETSKNI